MVLCQVVASIRHANDSDDDVTHQCVAREGFGCSCDRESKHCHSPIETLGACEVEPLSLLNSSVEPCESRTGTGHHVVPSGAELKCFVTVAGAPPMPLTLSSLVR